MSLHLVLPGPLVALLSLTLVAVGQVDRAEYACGSTEWKLLEYTMPCSRPASEVTHRLRCKSPDPRKSGQDTTRAPREPLCPGLLRRLLAPEPRLRADVCKEVEVHQDEASRILAEMRLARAGQHSR
ncbi:unnamed protein product [Effrenium voratum]|nr:unnamed protein product [Effrenium voratum]